MIINREWGLAKNENMNQGSFIVEELTRLVEEAVLSEFDRISERGGVLGAMETGYQRSKIQEESLYYEKLKHTGELPIIGVNTFRDPDADPEDFRKRHEAESPGALKRLQEAALEGRNIFAELMNTVRYCTLGQITQALYDVGGKYRRNM